MKKNNFIKSTIILIIGGAITKILGMIIKIITTRYMGSEGIGIYMLLTPTFMLLISISQLGFPVALSKLISEGKHSSKSLIFSTIPLSLIINSILLIIIFLSSKFIAYNLLHEPRTYYGVICIGLVLPFISISSIIRGYFFGKEKMLPHVVSNIFEDISRLIILSIGIPIFINKSIELAVAFIIISNIFSELLSIFILLLFLPKKANINLKGIKPDKEKINKILSISLPTTGSRIIGNIGYFLEPIILTSVLLFLGYSNEFILNEYGIISGYVLTILLLPSFFTLAISQALIPVISKSYSKKNIAYSKHKIKQAIMFSLLIGIPFTLFLELFPDFSLNFIYKTTKGIKYLRFLAPFCLLQYIQSPLSSALQAMGKAKEAMYGTLIGTISRTLLLLFLSFFKIGMWSLIISISFSIVFVTLYQIKTLHFYLNKKQLF